MPEYRLASDSIYTKFADLRTKFQVFGGGYANGKTAALCVLKALVVARDYPGANMLLGRATYPKLNDTLKKEFFKWCPPSWIKRMPTEKDNTCYLKNGTIVNFRYVQQRGKAKEEDTSNLLSATYDFIGIDQLEDPEFTYKDFADLLGRLRGSTPYRGNDSTMPTSGPRWFVFTTNPTSNWVYRRIVRPLHIYKETGRKIEGLLITDKDKLLIDIVEGSTYENRHVLAPDVIEALETAYTGQYRERFLLGKWASYEGLVYPSFSHETHVIPHATAVDYLHGLAKSGVYPEMLKGYDHGIAEQSCYLVGYADHLDNIVILDGFYEKEQSIAQLARRIHSIDAEYGAEADLPYADPQIFRRAGTIGPTVADMFMQENINMRRGANRIEGGIMKVVAYLAVKATRRNPFTRNWGAPNLFVSDRCEFLIDEFATYMWRRDPLGERIDEPVDRKNHAMDALRYLMTPRNTLAMVPKRLPLRERPYMRWSEPPDTPSDDGGYSRRAHRYAS